jgi:hypothetical protein
MSSNVRGGGYSITRTGSPEMNIRGTDFIYYQTNDIDRAIAFYRDTLGLEMYISKR